MNRKLIEYSLRLLYRHGVNGTNLKTFGKLLFSEKDVLKVNLKGYSYPIYLRKGSSDIDIFHEVLIKSDYKFQTKLESEPKTIIDCGANVGLASVFFKQKYPQAKIVCVEPEAKNYEMLQTNIKNYVDVHPYNVGVWGTDTYLEVKNKETTNSSGFVFKEVESKTADSVEAVSIKTIMSKFNIENIDILKIDVESAEKYLFGEGCDYWLSRTRLLIIELHDRMLDGCSEVFFSAMSKYHFSVEIKGENIFCFMK